MGFNRGFRFAEKHMPAVKRALGNLPVKIFFDIETASPKRDMEEATDLVLNLSSGDIAVRIRKREVFDKGLTFGLDWSVRYDNKGRKTEIDKLLEGFARWYFYGYSRDDEGKLIDWYLLDLDKIRKIQILKDDWPIYENFTYGKPDGTSGMYIKLKELDKRGCIVYQKAKS